MPRRAKGEGTYKATGQGWRYRVRRDGAEMYGPTMPTKAEAKRAALQRWATQEAESARPAAPDSLGELLSWAIRDMSRSNRETTIQAKEHLAKTWLTSPFAFRSFRALKPADEKRLETELQGFLDALAVPAGGGRSRPASPAHRRNVGSLLNQALALAGSRIRLRLPTVRDGVQRPLTKAERSRLRAACTTETERLAVALMMDMGLRRGEAVGALWQDYEEGSILVQRDLARVRGQLQDDDLKTAASRAPVPVPDYVRPLFEEGRIGFILGQGMSQPMTPETAARLIIRLAEEAGIPRRVTPQTLRATHDQMVMDTVRDPRIAADLARHDVATMVRHYLRATPETRAAARQAIDDGELSGDDRGQNRGQNRA
jgi:integrase